MMKDYLVFYCVNKFLSLSSLVMDERLDKFENMLSDILNNYNNEKIEIDRLKNEGKEKSATYKHYLGNRLLYNWIIAKYKEYGLIE